MAAAAARRSEPQIVVFSNEANPVTFAGFVVIASWIPRVVGQ
jgi:hypothetical protein